MMRVHPPHGGRLLENLAVLYVITRFVPWMQRMIAFNAYLERSRRELSKYILKKSNGLKLTILKIFKVLPVLQRANVKMPVPKVGRLPILSQVASIKNCRHAAVRIKVRKLYT